jgi:hypothetical protein
VLKAPVTPAAISESIYKLCDEVSPGLVPEYVEVVPDRDASMNECFPNVTAKVEREGGAMLIGWSIWESPGLFVEAEFHAVWRSPEGALIDITPKPARSDNILFLPQPGATYAGRQMNNVRRALGVDSEVEAYLRMHDAMFEFMNRGERAGQHGAMSIVGRDALEYETIAGNIQMLGARLARRAKHYDPYLPCWCGSGKKAKWCHKAPRPPG